MDPEGWNKSVYFWDTLVFFLSIYSNIDCFLYKNTLFLITINSSLFRICLNLSLVLPNNSTASPDVIYPLGILFFHDFALSYILWPL